MNRPLLIDVVIPALDEEQSISKVIGAIPHPPVRRVVVADNGSKDATAHMAKRAGAYVVYQSERGYGAACLQALAFVANEPPDVVVFLDADFSDEPGEIHKLIAPIENGDADFVVGARRPIEEGALTVPQKFGNKIACWGLRWLYGVTYTDIGPFRAIRWSVLEQLKMQDRNFGWTLEMQTKAARHKVRHAEVEVSYRKRIGESKISGTIRGVIGAGTKFIWILARYLFFRPRSRLRV